MPAIRVPRKKTNKTNLCTQLIVFVDQQNIILASQCTGSGLRSQVLISLHKITIPHAQPNPQTRRHVHAHAIFQSESCLS